VVIVLYTRISLVNAKELATILRVSHKAASGLV